MQDDNPERDMQVVHEDGRNACVSNSSLKQPIPTQPTSSVAVIVAAYNEAGRIGTVIEVLCRSSILDEIIVVDDGSTDGSSDEVLATARGDRRLVIFRHPINLGKGQAIFQGWRLSRAPIILYLDADLVNLHPEHVEGLVAPVQDDCADMSIGYFKGGHWRADAAHMLTPWLSGQRCMKSNLMNDVSPIAAEGYGVETAITIAARKNRWRCVKVPLRGVTHPLGEIPRGGYHGWKTKAIMFYQIGRAWFLTLDRGKMMKRLFRETLAE